MTLFFYISFAALWALVIFLSLVLLGVVRTLYRLQQDGVPHAGSPTLQGRPVPAFSGVDLAGEPVRSADFAGRLTALLFVGSDCETCEITLHDLEALDTKSKRNLIVICQGGEGACSELATAFEIGMPVVSDDDRRISDLFGISTVPTAVIVDEAGNISSVGHPLGGRQLEDLIAGAGEAEGRDLVVQHHPVGVNGGSAG